MLVISAADGGYDPHTGLDPSAKGEVAGSPPLLTKAELAAAEDAYGADSASQEQEVGWQSLDQHSSQVRAQAGALLRVLAPTIPNDSWPPRSPRAICMT